MPKRTSNVEVVAVVEAYSTGRGGWVCYRSRRIPVPVYLRLEEVGSDGFRIADLFLTGARVTGDLLRRLDLNRIQAFVTQDADHLRAHVRTDGPRLDEVTAMFSDVVERPLGEVEIEMPDATLEIPPARPYPLAFYQAVAELYQRLAAVTRAPAAVMADANGVEVSRVHEWVRVARRDHHLLPPGTRGKAG